MLFYLGLPLMAASSMAQNIIILVRAGLQDGDNSSRLVPFKEQKNIFCIFKQN
jgi:hypothetical protein